MNPLDDRLRDLGEHLDVPAGEALAARVAGRVRERRRRSSHRRLAIAFATLLVALVGLSFVPAVGDWLGVRGVEVAQEPAPTTTAARPPAPTPSPPPATALDLGTPTSLVAAAREVGFPMLLAPVLGPPEGVWLDTRPAVPIVTLTYPGGRLVSEFRAAIAAEPVLRKFAAGDVRVEELVVEGRRAVWVEGMHEVAVERAGEVFADELRLSDSALLVEVGDVTVRIETRFGRADAVEIARNLVASAGVRAP